jgi:hypothetical protein
VLNYIIDDELQLCSETGGRFIISPSFQGLGMVTCGFNDALNNVISIGIMDQGLNMALEFGNELNKVLVVDASDGSLDDTATEQYKNRFCEVNKAVTIALVGFNLQLNLPIFVHREV